MAESNVAKVLYCILIIIILVLAGTAVANFFDISFEAFGPYLVWFVALGIFFIALPKEVGSVFD